MPHTIDLDQCSSPSFTRIRLPRNNSRLGHRPEDCLAIVLDDVLSRSECDALRARGEPHLRYVREAVNVIDGERVPVTLLNPRDYKLAVFEDQLFVDDLWFRLKSRAGPAIQAFAARDGCGEPLGLNRRLRVLKYTDRDFFDMHYDQIVVDEESNTKSMITILIYLNDGGGREFSGGDTWFHDALNPLKGITPVVPRAGRVVLFEHELFHSGSRLAPGDMGAKFVVRTDVMFVAEPEPVPSDGSLAPAAGAMVASVSKHSDKANNLLDQLLSVSELLSHLELGHLHDKFRELGFLVSLEAFRCSGRNAATEMLLDLGISDSDVYRFIEAAFQ